MTCSMMMVSSSSKLLVFVLHGNMRTLFGMPLIRSSFLPQSLNIVPRGLFMNKYVFPGADASCSLGWVINKVC